MLVTYICIFLYIYAYHAVHKMDDINILNKL